MKKFYLQVYVEEYDAYDLVGIYNTREEAEAVGEGIEQSIIFEWEEPKRKEIGED